jgi:hypothetical protein
MNLEEMKNMPVLRIILLSGLVIIVAGLVWRIAPGKSKLFVSRDEPHFPLVSGYNLNRQEFEFPRDFDGKVNLVIIPFKQYQQTIVNTWIPTAQGIEASFPGFIYYELPTIYEMPVLSRTFINEGMRAGIPDETARQRTITLYLDKEAFKAALDISTEDDVYLFLVDREGEILWRATGEYSPEKANDLLQFIQELNSN